MENKPGEQHSAVPSKTTQLFPWAGLGVLLSTFSAIIVIITFYAAFYTISFYGKQLQTQVKNLSLHVNTLQEKIDAINKESKQAADALKATMDELRQAQAQNSDKESWRVMEANYFVNLADANLQFQHNIPTAIQLLQTADKKIQDINDLRLDSIRRALAEDIIVLQATPQVDYTGIYLRLSAINNQLEKLPLITKSLPVNQNPVQEVAQKEWWKKGLDETWQALQKIVVVRYHEKGVLPLTTPAQQNFIFQNCHAMLQQAMLGLLNKNKEVYQTSLQQANEWIKQYFLADQATQGVITNLSQLQEIDIHPSVPRVASSVQAFHDYFANLNTTITNKT